MLESGSVFPGHFLFGALTKTVEDFFKLLMGYFKLQSIYFSRRNGYTEANKVALTHTVGCKILEYFLGEKSTRPMFLAVCPAQ